MSEVMIFLGARIGGPGSGAGTQLEQGIRQANDNTCVASASKTTVNPKSYVAAAATANQAVTPGLELIDLLGFSNVTADSDTANYPLTKVDSYFCLSTKFITLASNQLNSHSFIVNSGTFPHMVNNQHLFTHM